MELCSGLFTNYSDKSFFDENKDVTIYMPDRILHYKIFAAYFYDSRHLLLNFDFNDPECSGLIWKAVLTQRDMNAFIDTDIPGDRGG